MRTYRELFGIGEFRVLFTTTSLNVGAGSVGSLALGTLVYAETGSPLLSAFVMFGGPLVRWRRRGSCSRSPTCGARAPP